MSASETWNPRMQIILIAFSAALVVLLMIDAVTRRS
jgi:hypothetical protein